LHISLKNAHRCLTKNEELSPLVARIGPMLCLGQIRESAD
jgi:hypothetical protein